MRGGWKTLGRRSSLFVPFCVPASVRPGFPAFLRVCVPAFLPLFLLSSCGRSAPRKPLAPHAPQTSGTVQLAGLQASVAVVRDASGIPHITASNTDDLFFAQGFVQAQDRLFQMDLWKRSVQGRLSEVLGANFIQRDSMTRRVQFRGDLDREWSSYGPDTRRIAVAFTNGINAWVRIARQDLPEEFALAGWAPEFWRPEDLLNRTDAFLASRNALDELFRARLVAALGAPRVDQLLPLPDGERTAIDPNVDLSAITYVVPDAVRRVGTPPFFLTLQGRVSEEPRPGTRAAQVASPGSSPGTFTRRAAERDAPPTTAPAGAAAPPRAAFERRLSSGGVAWAIGAAKSATGAPMLAVSSFGRFEIPSVRYLVHLSAPGWNVAGATSPWLPGVAIGHNDRIAWAMTTAAVDTQDIFVERVNPADTHQTERDGHWVDMAVDHERVDVKGRATPVEFDRLYTANGVVVAQDKERSLVYTLRWSGTEPGGAAELGALAVGRATSWPEFRAALAHWKMPVADFVYADVDGHVARQRAGLAPIRPAGWGNLPARGWSSDRTWRGFVDLTAAAAMVDPPAAFVLSAEVDAARQARLNEVLAGPGARSLEDIRRLSEDVKAWNASQILPVLQKIGLVPEDIRAARDRLLGWDGRVDAESAESAVYVAWEDAIRSLLANQARVPDELRGEFATLVDPVPVITHPTAVWFPGDVILGRDRLLVDALSLVAREVGPGQIAARTTTFEHPLAVFEPARRRFNSAPVPQPGYPDTVFAADSRGGPFFSAVFDVKDWGNSVVANLPGQSGSPASPHYDDFAAKRLSGEASFLSFARTSTESAAAETLILRPR